MSSIEPTRGHIYRMYDPEYGTLHCLVISTIPASDVEDNCLAMRVTVTGKAHSFPYWVRLGSGDPGFGYVVVHDLDRVDHDELKEDLGPLSAETMGRVERELKRVLGL